MSRLALPQPTLILMMGVAASGKTTVSKKLLERLNLSYLDNNFIADSFFPDTRNDREYLKLRPFVYRILYRITEENLAVGNSVLLDAPHVKEMQDTQWQKRISGLVKGVEAKLFIVRCFCSGEILKQRIISRGEVRDAWKLSHWEEFNSEQPMDVKIPFEHLDINTEHDLRENVDLIINFLLAGTQASNVEQVTS